MNEEFWRTKLTPFDAELCMMVESLTGKPCEPLLGGKHEYFIVVDYSEHDDPDYIAAVMSAVAGRVSDRLIRIQDESEYKRFIANIYFGGGPYPRVESAPNSMPRLAVGELYKHGNDEVLAVQVSFENRERLFIFVGGGDMEIDESGVILHFLNASKCVWEQAKTGDYVVYLSDGLFGVVPKDKFEVEYFRKK